MQLFRDVAQDARHTLRLWASRPWHTGFRIAALAIGTGANTGVFSVVNALLLRSLPFREPGRLAALKNFFPPHDSAKQFHDWRRQSAYLADAALIEDADFNLGGSGTSIRAHVAQVSWNLFSTLGTRPVVGRGFLPDEDTKGRNAVAVIGYGLWQQLFAGDRRALRASIRIDGNPLTIVGVAPPGFDYPNGAVLWKAASFSPGNNGWDTIGRLKSGITWAHAREAFSAEAKPLAPNLLPMLTPLQEQLAGPAKDASLMLMAGVVLILLIACTNVANLLMAGTADRSTELSIRSALGASRARIARQLVTECLLLSFAAAMAGLLVAFWTTVIAAKVQPPPLAAQSYSILDVRVLAFTALASILSSLLFGVLPSLYAGRLHAFGTRGSGKTRGSRLVRETLIAAQVMLTLVLLTASISVGRAFVSMMQFDRGFDVRGLVTVSVSLGGTTHQLPGRALSWFDEALERIRRLPGVRSASATDFLPLNASSFIGGPFGLDGRPAEKNSMVVPVLSDYFQTMGGHILYGREFTPAEVRSDAGVAIVNERFAAGFGAPAEALGRQLTNEKDPPLKIIGIVKGMDYGADAAAINPGQVFLPAHSPGGFFSTLVVRFNGPAEKHLAAVRDAIRSVDPQVPVFGMKTMEQRLDDALARPKFYRTAIRFFAAFALLLAVIGIYGVVSYAVAQRTQEMGVRMALGTTPVRLRGILLRQGLLSVAAGAIPGIVAAILGGSFLRSLIVGATSVDAVTIALSVLFIALIASISIWVATRRIGRLDIMSILRIE